MIHQLGTQQNLTHRVVSQRLTLLANDDDIVVVLHVLVQLARLLEALLAGGTLEEMVGAFLLRTAGHCWAERVLVGFLCPMLFSC